MPIPIHPEPESESRFFSDMEACCFCRTRTTFWTTLSDRKGGEQVACCPDCAARGEHQDVPTKAVWCRRERIAHRPTIGEISTGQDQEYPPAPIVVPPP